MRFARLAKNIQLLLPFILLLILFGFLYRALLTAKPQQTPTALIGSAVPAFQLPDLIQPKKIFSEKALQGHVTLLNIWATWCYACALEHPMLLKLKETYHLPIYSINYKDNAQAARAWLAKMATLTY